MIVGNIYTNAKDVDLNPAHNAFKGLIFAPNSSVKFTGGEVEGMIVADNVVMGGNSQFIYQPSTIDRNSDISEPGTARPLLRVVDPLKEVN